MQYSNATETSRLYRLTKFSILRLWPRVFRCRNSLIKQTASILLLLAVTGAAAQNTDTKAFLEKNKEPVTPELAANALFDTAFYQNRLFLFGENHGSAQPQQYDLALLKHLHRHAGIKYYIAELDCTKAWMINNYLRDGNTGWLNKVFAGWNKDTSQWANKEYYNKFVQLHSYQQSLPENKKITVLGVDVLQDYSLLEEHMAFLTGSSKFEKYRSFIDTLNGMVKNNSNRPELIAFSKRLLPVIRADSLFFRKSMGERYFSFRQLITSLTFLSAGMYRDSVMYRNLASQTEMLNLRNEKMYGFLGFFHCLQTGYNKSMPFAALVKKEGGAVVSIQMFALNCKTMLPYVAQVRQMMPKTYVDKLLQENKDFKGNGKYVPYDLSNDNFMMMVDGIGELKELSQPGSVYLFKLTGAASPFNHVSKLAQITGFQSLSLNSKDSHTTDAFQYILLFRNSEAATPLE